MRKFLIAAAVMTAFSAGAANAATSIVDPANDIIQNYKDHHAGTPAQSLDIASFSVDLINGIFLLDATFEGSITDGLPGDWVLGIDTGGGTNHGFDTIGEGNILFTKTLAIGKNFQPVFNGTPLTATPITNNGVTNEFRLSIPAQLLTPGATLDPAKFGFSLWSRDGSGGINSIADFAPNNTTVSSGAPEPMSWALMIFGFGMAGATLRGRRKAAASL